MYTKFKSRDTGPSWETLFVFYLYMQKNIQIQCTLYSVNGQYELSLLTYIPVRVSVFLLPSGVVGRCTVTVHPTLQYTPNCHILYILHGLRKKEYWGELWL